MLNNSQVMPEYSRETLDDFIRKFPETPFFSGRGVVISAGGPYVHLAYLAVRSLRLQGCGLPIQIWHLGPDEFPASLREPFRSYKVEFVNSFDYLDRFPMNLGGWQNKIFSIVRSPFNEVFSFDADNFALANPEGLFDSDLYKAEGHLFWPDFENGDPVSRIKPYAWEFLGLPALENAELESGQLLIDKSRNWRPLQVALHMNANSDFYYKKCTWGDKDTYRLAYSYLGDPLAVVPFRPKFISKEFEIWNQYSPNGKSMFQHGRKWRVPLNLNRFIRGYEMEDEAFEWLEEFLSLS